MLLRPSAELNRLVLGMIGRALQHYDVALCGFAFLSNHAHLQIAPANSEALSGFMRHIKQNITVQVARFMTGMGR